MKKKLISLAEKTSADKKQIAKLSKLGLFSIILMLISGIAACSTAPSKTDLPKDNPQTAKPATPKDEDGEMPVIRPKKPAASPWEGYPAGTRYSTVSPKDF